MTMNKELNFKTLEFVDVGRIIVNRKQAIRSRR
jgi:hypothetical protein